ncbi:MAG: UbiX family flavin prenyltransferase [Rikenellaceae bacterium]
MKLIVAITAASGAIYARQLVDHAIADSNVESVAVIYSSSAREVVAYEGEKIGQDPKIVELANNDLFAPPASGSANFDAMVIIPASMGTIGRIASGASDSLITRSADVMLKERKKLIIVAREAPLSLIHLRNMVTLTESGAIIFPASPTLYSKPQTIEELAQTVSARAAKMAGINCSSFEWKGGCC